MEELRLASDRYRLWWEALAENSTVPSSLRLISKRVIESRLQVGAAFSRVTHKTREMLDSYIYYLYYVERSVKPIPGLLIERGFYAGIRL